MAYKRIYLIRHGRTVGNEEKRYTGIRTDEGLSESGLAEAELARKRICGITGPVIRPDRVVSGSMKRAAETASVLFPGHKAEVMEDLTEMDLGFFEGKTYKELSGEEFYQRWIDSNGTLDIPGGEKRQDFIERSNGAFLHVLGDMEISETIAVVCHGGNIMAVMSELFGGDFYDYLTVNLCGFCLDLETDNAGIHPLSYHKFDPWDNN